MSFKLPVIIFSIFFIFCSAYLTAKECNLPKFESMDSNFGLTGHDGKKYTRDSLKGKIVWIYFGYTFCPDACPMTMSNFKKVYKELGDLSKQVQVLFITIDPERDTQAVLKNYMGFFNPSFMALRGNEEETKAVADNYYVTYTSEEIENDGVKYKLFAHTDRVFLLDKQGIIRSLPNVSKNSDQLLSDTLELLNNCS